MKSVPVYIQFMIYLSLYLYYNGLVLDFQASTMQIFHLSLLFFFFFLVIPRSCSEIPPRCNLPRFPYRTSCPAGRTPFPPSKQQGLSGFFTEIIFSS